MPPMPFPGPFAHMPAPAVVKEEDAHSEGRMPSPRQARQPYPGSDDTGATELGERADLHIDQLGFLPLTYAAARGNLVQVQALLDAGAPANFSDFRHGCTTALIEAVRAGNHNVVELLAQQPDIELNKKNADGCSALYFACLTERIDIMERLLDAGADINLLQGKEGNTVLSLAASHGQADIARHLLARHDLELDKPGHDNRTALMTAAYHGNAEVAALLLAAGASRSAVDADYEFTALGFARWKRHAGVVEVFLAHGEEIDKQNLRVLWFSCNTYSITVADLHAARTPSSFAANVDRLGQDFFSKIIPVPGTDEWDEQMLKCLYEQGMSSACAHAVKNALSGPYAPWRMKNTDARQNMFYCLGVLSGMHRQHVKTKAVWPYVATGISAEAINRLTTIAVAQLEELAHLAAQTLARIGGGKLDTLFDGCMKNMGIGGQTDVDGLKAALLDEGFCAPVATAIAASWQAAVKAVEQDTMTVPPGMTLAAVMALSRAYITERTPLLFAREMLRELDSRDRLSDLQAAMADEDDEDDKDDEDDEHDDGLHLMFQIQCAQLRQYCEQTLDLPESTLGTSSTASTSSSTSASGQQSNGPVQQ